MLKATLLGALAVWGASNATAAQPQDLCPVRPDKPGLTAPHLPDRAHTFIWRNWENIEPQRISDVLRTSREVVEQRAAAMGLPVEGVQRAPLERNYIAVIRRNWHLLNYDQLLTLLGWDAARLAEVLREDDFLWAKLGMLKPAVELLGWVEPTPAVEARCREIRKFVETEFGEALKQPGEAPFEFLKDFEKTSSPPPGLPGRDEPVRFCYSYAALYGDPLAEGAPDPYPPGLLEQLRGSGVNGVWMHTVLRQLHPGGLFPDDGQSAGRLLRLARIVERVGQRGVRIYLYTNEPRAMPLSFFEGRQELKGVQEGPYAAVCTSNPQVRQWLTEATAAVLKAAPELGGVFTITASENLTNCWSHHQGKACPRCGPRGAAEVIAEVNTAIAEGAKRGSPQARVIVWDWGFLNETCAPIITKLPDGVSVMSVSEWDLPITRGGVATAVGEYSLSAVGPGPRATANWAAARKRGLPTIAKVQANCTWELSAIPWLPVMELVARHASNLAREELNGVMLSWTLGGYPSPNLRVFQLASQRPAASPAELMQAVARERYGPAADQVVAAWSAFSKAFEQYPYNGSVIYNCPAQLGPANLFYERPTGFASTMVGFPYDHLEGWRANYPAEVFTSQFERMAKEWEPGLELMRKAAAAAPDRSLMARDLGLAEAAGLHLASVGNQARFVMLRDTLAKADPARQAELRAGMAAIARRELEIARRMFTLSRNDSRIGYEASNHYYYRPLDFVEKAISCQAIEGSMK